LFNKVFKFNQVNIGEPVAIDNIRKNLKIDEPIIEENEIFDENLLNEELIENGQIKAQKIVDEAKRTAEEIINRANNKAEDIKAMAFEEAKKEGYEVGLLKGYEENKAIIEESQRIRDDTESLFEDTVRSMEKELINFIIDIAEKVLDYEMENNEEYILGLINKSLKKTNERDEITIKLAKTDYDFIKMNELEMREKFVELNSWHLVVDEKLVKGDLLVETSYGTIDASMRKQIDIIKETFNSIIMENDR
jgi:flagellar assembly protein FliH